MKNSQMCVWVILGATILISPLIRGDDGYDLWLKYRKIGDTAKLNAYGERLSSVLIPGKSDTQRIIQDEVVRALGGLLGMNISVQKTMAKRQGLIIATAHELAALTDLDWAGDVASVGDEGYLIRNAEIKGASCLVITANEDIGLLYGTFHLLRLMQTGQSVNALDIGSRPRIQYRLLNHWDNLDGSIERGYAGKSLWQELCHRYQRGVRYVAGMRKDWDTLKAQVDPELFAHVQAKLATQERDAAIWRDTCLKYFQTFSQQPITPMP